MISGPWVLGLEDNHTAHQVHTIKWEHRDGRMDQWPSGWDSLIQSFNVGRNQGTAGTAWHWNQAGKCSNPNRPCLSCGTLRFSTHRPMISSWKASTTIWALQSYLEVLLMCVQCLAQHPRTSPRDVSQGGEGQEKGRRNGGEITAQGASAGLRIAWTLSP